MNDELLSRACRAYLRTDDRVPLPSWADSDVNRHGTDAAIITLRNANGVLARYRFRAGRLRRLVEQAVDRDSPHDSRVASCPPRPTTTGPLGRKLHGDRR